MVARRKKRHFIVGNDASVDQIGDQLVVLAGRSEPSGGAGGGPSLPNNRPDAGVAGVLLVPVGRAGREGEQDRQVAAAIRCMI
jgi:hypothetical protein